MRHPLAALMVLTIAAPHWARAQAPLQPTLPGPVDLSPAAARAASDAYARAVKKHASGDLNGAIEEADVSWRAVPNASTALIRATLLAEAGRNEEAFNAYLQAADLDPTDDEKALVRSGLAQVGPRCTPGLGWAHVTTSVPGARVEVDGVMVDASRTIGLAAGTRRVRVQADGHAPLDVALSVEAGAAAERHLVLEQIVPAPPEDRQDIGTPEDAAPQVQTDLATAVLSPDDPGTPLLPWVLVGTGAAMAVTGGVMFGLATESDGLASSLADPSAGGSAADRKALYDDALSDLRTYEITGWVLTTAGLATAITGAVLLAVDGGDDAAPAATLAPGLGSLTISTRF